MINKQPVQLDPALQALMVLKQRANPVTPNGQPTVAGQVAQQAQQGIMAAMAPSTPSVEPQGIMGVLDQARKAMPSVQQNAQQAQMDGIASQVAQKMQQQNQPSGVTGLPAGNMGFAEGGIIGFDAGGTAPNLTSSDLQTVPIELLREQVNGPESKSVTSQVYDAIRNLFTSDTRPERQPGKGNGQVTDIPAAPTKPIAPAKATIPTSSGSASASVKIPGDVLNPEDRLSSIYNKFMKPGIDAVTSDRVEMMKDAESAKKVREEAPPVQRTALEANKQAMDELQALHNQANADAPMNRLRAWMQAAGSTPSGSLGGAGKATMDYDAAEQNRQKAFIAQKMLMAEKQSAIEDAQAAQKIGNVDAYNAAKQRAYTADQKIAEVQGQFAGHGVQYEGQLQSAQMQAQAHILGINIAHSLQRGDKMLEIRERAYRDVVADPENKQLATMAALPGPIGEKARADINNLINTALNRAQQFIFNGKIPEPAQPSVSAAGWGKMSVK